MADAEPTEPPDLTEEEIAFADIFAHARSMGGREDMQETTEETAQAIFALMRTNEYQQRIVTLHQLTGEFMHAASLVEQEIAPIVVFLMNQTSPDRVKGAVLALGAGKQLDMWKTLFRGDWPEGNLLLSHLRELASFRNRIAHGSWAFVRLDSEGKMEQGQWLQGVSRIKGQWATNQEPVSNELLRQRIEDARALQRVLHHYLLIAVRTWVYASVENPCVTFSEVMREPEQMRPAVVDSIHAEAINRLFPLSASAAKADTSA